MGQSLGSYVIKLGIHHPRKNDRKKEGVLRVAVCGCSECIQPSERILYSEQREQPRMHSEQPTLPEMLNDTSLETAHTNTQGCVACVCVFACLRVLCVCLRVCVCVCWCAYACAHSEQGNVVALNALIQRGCSESFHTGEEATCHAWRRSDLKYLELQIYHFSSGPDRSFE